MLRRLVDWLGGWLSNQGAKGLADLGSEIAIFCSSHVEVAIILELL
jgi:hypothetical protein